MSREHGRGPAKIAAIYALTGILWILLSDRIVAFLYHDQETVTRISIFKGWAYVVLTSLLLYLLIRQYAREITGSETTLRERNQELLGLKEQLQHQLAENVKRQQELFEAHQTLKAIVSASPVGIVALDRVGKVTLWNKKAEKLFGWSEEEVVGRLYQLIPPSETTEAQRNVESVLQGRVLTDVETRRLRKNGDLLDVSLSVSPLRSSEGDITGIIVIFADITERKRAAEILRQSEENYRLLFASNPHPMWVFDVETLAFLEVNAAAVRQYGWSREEFLAMTISDIRPAEDVPQLVDVLAMEVAGHNNHGVWRHRKKDGTVIHVEIATHTLEFAGRNAKLVLCIDVTEQIAAREQILQLNAELEDRVRLRTAALETANQEMEAFSYSVSHDLRAPLRHLDGYCSVLREEYSARFDDKGRGYLDRIGAAVRKMDQLINDMLQLAQVSRQGIDKSVVDLSGLAVEILEDLRQSQPQRSLSGMVAPGIEVLGDPNLLRLVMENLISNAWKYTGKTADAVIEFGMTRQEDQPVYFVRDNGVGFDMTYAGKLFGPFQRLHASEEFEGTGIGLATVKRIIQRHGGRIWAEGKENRGAVFYFTLPG
ncbi:MAG TPA: PAS domain S-box protein [Geobacteraceae bacterium]|nr:PAS domain S-box protein [Geobacteraceae bacterium]